MHNRSLPATLILTALLLSFLLSGCGAPAPDPAAGALELALQDLEAGIAFHDAHDYPAAVKAFSDALEKDPDLSEAYFRRALAYYLDYNLETALADIEKGFAIGFEPETASQFVVRGRAYSLQERNTEAMADFEKAIEVDPAYAEAYVRRGNLLAFDFNDTDAALADMDRAIELAPDYALAYQKRGSVYRSRNEFDPAIADLTRAIELDPAEPFYLSVLGEIYLVLSEFETAIEYFDAALAQDERIPEAYYYRGLAFANLGNFPPALADMQEYVTRVPEDPGGYYFLGLLSFDQGMYEEAVSQFEESIARGLDAQRTSSANQYIANAYQQLIARERYAQLLVTLEEAGGAGGGSWSFDRENIWASGGCRYFNAASSGTGAGLAAFFTCAIELGPVEGLGDFADMYPDAVQLDSAFEYPGDADLYGYLDEAPHFEIRVLRDGFLHVVNVTAGAQVELEELQAAFTGPVEEFIHAVMTLALAHTETLVGTVSPPGSAPSTAWLAVAEDLNAIETEIGILNWEPTQETPGESQACRFFRGQSWSAIPNEAFNCIINTTPGNSFEELVEWMFESGLLLEGETLVDSALPLEEAHAVYFGMLDNGHSVFDLLVLKDGRMYWASVSLGTPAGSTPLSVYEANREAIEGFLLALIRLNFERSG